MIEIVQIYSTPDIDREDLLTDYVWIETVDNISAEYPRLDIDENLFYRYTGNGVAFYAPKDSLCRRTC